MSSLWTITAPARAYVHLALRGKSNKRSGLQVKHCIGPLMIRVSGDVKRLSSANWRQQFNDVQSQHRNDDLAKELEAHLFTLLIVGRGISGVKVCHHCSPHDRSAGKAYSHPPNP